MTTKTGLFTFATGQHLIDALVAECGALGIPPDDSAIVQRLRQVNFQPQYPSAEMFVSQQKPKRVDKFGELA